MSDDADRHDDPTSAKRLAQLDLALTSLRPRPAPRMGTRATIDRALAPLKARQAKPLPRERTALAAWFWKSTASCSASSSC